MIQPRRSFLAGLMFSGLLLVTAGAQAQNIKEHTFRFALQPAKGTSQVQGAQKFADLVSAKSGGKMTVKVYEGGALGTDVSVLSSMQGGTIDFSLSRQSRNQTGNTIGGEPMAR